MRRGSRTLLALTTFLTLFGVWLVLERGSDHRPTPGVAARRLFSAFSPQTLTRIVISGPTGAITIARATRKRSPWRLVLARRPLADGQTVARLISAIVGMRLRDRVTERVSRHAALGVDQVTGTRIRLFSASAPLADLLLGRVIDGHTMVRAAKAEPVWQAVGDLKALAVPSWRFWRDRRVLAFDVNDARRLAIESAAGALRLERAAAASPWSAASTAPAEAPIDSSAVDRWLLALSTLTAEGFLDDPDSASLGAFAAPLARVRIELAAAKGSTPTSGLTLTIVRSPHPEEEGLLLRRDDHSQIFVISTTTSAAITNSPLLVPGSP
ncbi:MAG: DUF4340 domain-containing protein [Proteobacteria bacterium]|nr:DUF4340 domain-containing protein [Pseudomonadota bacterium]